ncbi:hypothetical protein O181_099900 [Austropuccinia psidii MF-1]|uniref:Reverse transcriptase Ty1/copia-type domain-containing protein n=1 Tax=Austropuccinia psidii MF-1 TaxID=1389203 RepID=A0A9Q3JEI2_9BASI|nr:hypothetical protein [Austropuccinia psidii MF-1]
MDVRCAFLNGVPQEKLLIKRPNGLKDFPHKNHFILNKSLNGLKQSPRCWHVYLKKSLNKLDLIASETDPFLFLNNSKPFWLYLHVDDQIFGGKDIDIFKKGIHKVFDMEDLGPIKFALGIRIKKSKDKVLLIQDKFIHNMQKEFNAENLCPAFTPLPRNYKKLDSQDNDPNFKTPFNFQRAICKSFRTSKVEFGDTTIF